MSFSLVFPCDGWLGLSQHEASQSDVFLDGSGDSLAETGDRGRHPWALRLLSHERRLGSLASHGAGPNPKLVALVLKIITYSVRVKRVSIHLCCMGTTISESTASQGLDDIVNMRHNDGYVQAYDCFVIVVL